MAKWLLKTEPGCYSFADLARDGKTVWAGVTNTTALIHIRAMRKGDEAFIYHTGGERAVVGTATVTTKPYPDPAAGDERIVIVDVKFGKSLKRPVTLDEFKSDPAFAGWDLLRIGRLSVVPVSEAIWKRVLKLSSTDGAKLLREKRSVARSRA